MNKCFLFIAIIPLLAFATGLVIFPVYPWHEPPIPKFRKAKVSIAEFEIGLKRYKDDCHDYPDDSSPETVAGELTGYKESPDVMHDFSGNPDWRGPYMNIKPSQHENGKRNAALIDPWGQKYHFNLNNPQHNKSGVDIWSSGPNRIDEGGAGNDISNWQ